MSIGRAAARPVGRGVVDERADGGLRRAGGEVDAGRSARRRPSGARPAASACRLLLRRPGFIVGAADPAVLDRVRRSAATASRRTTRSTTSSTPNQRAERRTPARHRPARPRRALAGDGRRPRRAHRGADRGHRSSVALGHDARPDHGLLPGLGRRGASAASSRRCCRSRSCSSPCSSSSSLGASTPRRDRHGRRAVHPDRGPHRARGRARRGPARLRHVGPAARRVRACS